MMAFDHSSLPHTAFNDVRINCTLNKIIHLSQRFGLFLKNRDELIADDFTLLFWIRYTRQLSQKTRASIDTVDLEPQLFVISLHNLVAFILAQQAMVYKDAG